MTNHTYFPPAKGEESSPSDHSSHPTSGGSSGRKKTSKPEPTKLSVVGVTMAFFSFALATAVLFFIWRLLPTNAMSFAKNSILGFSLIKMLRSLFCLALPFIFFSLRFRYFGTAYLGSRLSGHWVVHGILIGIPTGFVIFSLHNLFIHFLVSHGISFSPATYLFPPNALRGPAHVLLMTAGVMLPVVTASLFLYGLLVPAFPTRKMGINILFSSIILALYVQSPVDVPALLVFGLIFGFLRYTSGHTLPGLLGMVTAASTVYLIAPHITFLSYSATVNHLENDPGIIYTNYIALFSGLFVVGWILFQCYSNMKNEKIARYPRSETLYTITGTPPIPVVLVGCLLLVLPWFFI